MTPTPSRASQALEALRQDLARQNPELTPKERLGGSFRCLEAEVEGFGAWTLEVLELREEGRAHAAGDDLIYCVKELLGVMNQLPGAVFRCIETLPMPEKRRLSHL